MPLLSLIFIPSKYSDEIFEALYQSKLSDMFECILAPTKMDVSHQSERTHLGFGSFVEILINWLREKTCNDHHHNHLYSTYQERGYYNEDEEEEHGLIDQENMTAEEEDDFRKLCRKYKENFFWLRNTLIVAPMSSNELTGLPIHLQKKIFKAYQILAEEYNYIWYNKNERPISVQVDHISRYLLIMDELEKMALANDSNASSIKIQHPPSLESLEQMLTL